MIAGGADEKLDLAVRIGVRMYSKEEVGLFLFALDEGMGGLGCRRFRGGGPKGRKELGRGQPAAQLHRQTA